MTHTPRLILRVAIVVSVALIALLLVDFAMTLSEDLHSAAGDMVALSLLAGLLLAYALLIAVPFVPGIEIGVALLVMRGADMAPAVYGATVAGLLLAYGVGRLIPPQSLAGFLRDFRLIRAADLVQRYSDLPVEDRLEKMNTALPSALGLLLVRARYLTLAGVLNLPGNALLGGGGGLLLLAGVTRTFRPLPTILMVLLAVLPVPLIVWIWGPGILS